MMNSTGRRFPGTIHLYPTMRCPLNCSYCYVEDVNKDRQEMELSTYYSLMDECLSLGVHTFDIAGGEPLLWPHLLQLLRAIRARGAISRVVTSGLLLDKLFGALEQERSLISELHVSLDSDDPYLHDTTRGLKGLHRKVVANVKHYVMEQLGAIRINYVLQKGTCHNLENMLSFAASLGVDGIDIQCMIDVSSKTSVQNSSLSPEELIAAYDDINRWVEHDAPEHFQVLFVAPGYMFPFFRSREHHRQNPNRLEIVYFPGLRGSSAFTDALFIKHNGEVTGSTTLINHEEWFIGNAGSHTLKEIWEEEAPKMINRIKNRSKELMTTGVCKDCPVKRFCRGGDPVIFRTVDQNQYCLLKEPLNNLTLYQGVK